MMPRTTSRPPSPVAVPVDLGRGQVMKLLAFDRNAARAARRVLEYNPYHGKDGRFTDKSGAASTSVYPGRPSLGNRKDATAAEVAYRKGAGVESPRLRQDNRERGGGIGAETAYRLARRSLQGKTTDGRPDSPHVRREMADGWKKMAAEKTARRRKTAGGDRQAVPQDPKKYTRRGSSGKPVPGALERRNERLPGEGGWLPPGETPRQRQWRRSLPEGSAASLHKDAAYATRAARKLIGAKKYDDGTSFLVSAEGYRAQALRKGRRDASVKAGS